MKTITLKLSINPILLADQKRILFKVFDTLDKDERMKILGLLTLLDQIEELSENQPPPDGHQLNN